MSSISQSIPNFLLGVSQQPDNRKRPGQVNDAINTFPDFALGMLKRPGGKFISKLEGATVRGKWFPIMRDGTEKYIGQYDTTDNVFRIWDLTTGKRSTVDATAVIANGSSCNTSDRNTARTNIVTTKTALDNARDALYGASGTASIYAKAIDGQDPTATTTFVTDSRVMSNSRRSTYTDTIKQYVTTGVLKNADGEFTYKKNGTLLDGVVNYLAIKDPGVVTSLSSTPTNVATTTSGSGTGLTVNLTITNGLVTAVTIHTNGTGYVHGDEIYPTGHSEIVLTVGGIKAGNERTDENPSQASRGYRVYELEEYIAPTHTAAQLATAKSNYDSDITDYDTAKTNYDNAVTELTTQETNCNPGTPPSDYYLKDAAVDDIELLTMNDYTFVINKAKEVALKTTTTHTGIDANRACVVVQLASNGTEFKITLQIGSNTATTFTHTSPTSGANSATIASTLASLVDANSDYTAFAVGPSIIITSSSAFKMSVGGGIDTDAIYGFTDSISNVSRLPLQCKNGYVVKVVNAADVDIDDMYVEFTANNGAAQGVGQWSETTEPGLKFELDEKTMPLALVNTAAGQFELQFINWNDRIVGDNVTNPAPSFVGNKISHTFFYRNRMGFLSGQNVVLSQAGDIFNFWNTTARTSVSSDPIDISAAGKKPVFLKYVTPTAVGLVMYSTNEQFILTTDSDILAPISAKVNQLSEYECDPNVESVSLGTSQAFITKTPLFSRVSELTDITAEQPPLKSDITGAVTEWIPQDVDSMISSPALSMVSIGKTGSSDLYQYRFLANNRSERVLNSWYKWKLTGQLLTQFFDSSTYFAVTSNGTAATNDVYVQSYDMTQSSEEGFLTLPTGEKTDVCLDLFNVNPYRKYDGTGFSKKTRIFLPYDSVSGAELNVVVLGGFIGDSNSSSSESVGAILKPTIAGNAGAQHVDIDGDYRGRDIIIGYNYTMEIELPQIFKYTVQGENVVNDDVSSLIIHRLKFKTGLCGPVDYKVSITGFKDWDNAVSRTLPNEYKLNNVNMQARATHVVPVYQRNENLAVKIIGNTPFPVSLLSLDWEGKFNQRFYRRG